MQYAGRLQRVRQAADQRRLGADDDEADVMRAAEVDYRRMIAGIERHHLRGVRYPGVTRRAIQPVAQRALGDRPGQGMLAATGADDENVHGSARAWG